MTAPGLLLLGALIGGTLAVWGGQFLAWTDRRHFATTDTACPQCRAAADADAAVERVVAEWRAEIEREVGAS